MGQAGNPAGRRAAHGAPSGLGEPALRFEIRQAETGWAWIRRTEARATIAESDQTFPSAAQASAAALAIADLVPRTGKSLTATSSSGTLL